MSAENGSSARPRSAARSAAMTIVRNRRLGGQPVVEVAVLHVPREHEPHVDAGRCRERYRLPAADEIALADERATEVVRRRDETAAVVNEELQAAAVELGRDA